MKVARLLILALALLALAVMPGAAAPQASAYAKTLSAEQPYFVFLTPLGDCALYVAEKAATSFTARALNGQKCSVAFDYRVVALRRGYETVRMEQFAEVSDE